jgi:hypothetical protein
MFNSSSRPLFASAAAILVIGLCGCEGTSYDNTPAQGDARKGLEIALAAWQGGKKPDAVDSTAPVMKVVDSNWLSGQKLAGYQIVSEDEADGQKRFTVKLSLSQPKREQEARYVVLGKDPLWVYREEDFVREMNMDDKPAPNPRRGRR